MTTATTHANFAPTVPLLGSQGWITPPVFDESDGLIGLLREWLRRSRTRHEIAELDDHLLRDIGLTRYEAAAEGRKHFWQS
jgi:uncharacterized protein YjiS (DUF1127 family)